MTLFKSVSEGGEQRGGELGAGQLGEWAADIAARLAALEAQPQAWRNTPVPGMADRSNPWFLQPRNSADGDKTSLFLSSLPGGEKLTGILRSETFAAPASLSFYMAGHNGPPDKPNRRKSLMRLCEAGTGKIIVMTYAPGSDVAKAFTWDLHEAAGKQVYLEIVDGDSGMGLRVAGGGTVQSGGGGIAED